MKISYSTHTDEETGHAENTTPERQLSRVDSAVPLTDSVFSPVDYIKNNRTRIAIGIGIGVFLAAIATCALVVSHLVLRPQLSPSQDAETKTFRETKADPFSGHENLRGTAGKEPLLLAGIDPVQYFNLAEGDDAVMGDASRFSTQWEGVRVAFVSKENLELFIKDPERYLPVFGGYDPIGLTQLTLAISNPNYWKIHNGRLYLFLGPINKVIWERDPSEMNRRAKLVWTARLPDNTR
eukprot:TRINITY_DN152618_c0_g1_i5.p1 TRINITY_DN152618_c0_g1~~TRINITY_DN152618_c0_g1_i5.p1  ORF type:complete len:238 (+),score=17.52 TRINITY_DN152618_c0_g1_i5:87-800(+)